MNLHVRQQLEERDRAAADARGADGGLRAPVSVSGIAARALGALKSPPGWRLFTGLSFKLLLLTAVFVMVAEILIFLPSIANYRIGWLNDRLMAAYVATLAADAAPGGEVPPQLRSELIRTALVRAVALRRDGKHRLVLPPVADLTIDAHYDLRPDIGETFQDWFATRLAQIGDALAVFAAPEDRTLRVTGLLGPRRDDTIEIVLPEAPLKRAMIRYSLDILWLSIIVSLITAAFVYLVLRRLFVKPLTRLARNMLRFSQDPEDASRIIAPSGRQDEVGTAERELAGMQRELSQLLLQKNRLAQIGLAVSKINHDLRNMLANAQLISDRLGASRDPTVQTFAPKLIASLDRAINFCNGTLKFGRAEEAAPRRELMLLAPLVEEVGDGLGLPREDGVLWKIDIDQRLRVDADRDHLFRVLSNLVRNAIQAIESQGAGTGGEIAVAARREGRRVLIDVRDTGPGVLPRARQNLFKPFQGSTKKNGSGLGLAIAHELVAAHGGELTLLDTPSGAAFRIDMPDRGAR